MAGKNPKLLVFSGAGISAESGISTFRDAGGNGLWNGYRIEDVCTSHTWKQNFALVHSFYNARRQQLGQANPSSAHAMVASWQARYDTTIITQNVDDLLERAGVQNVIHLHGFLREMLCTACGQIWDYSSHSLN